MTQDIFGQDTSLSSAATQARWDAAQMGVLAHSAATADHLGAVLAAAPDFAQAQAIKGLSVLMLGRSELVPMAQEALSDAKLGYEPTFPKWPAV
ncbi:hypothetical protein [Pseudophaeobacter sp. TrK17]|uniref:hypothetical protein n=1 Tax=Pseudophaeobacter sp. TrK17 TaxID=2815167 RepID=UPI0035D04C41